MHQLWVKSPSLVSAARQRFTAGAALPLSLSLTDLLSFTFMPFVPLMPGRKRLILWPSLTWQCRQWTEPLWSETWAVKHRGDHSLCFTLWVLQSKLKNKHTKRKRTDKSNYKYSRFFLYCWKGDFNLQLTIKHDRTDTGYLLFFSSSVFYLMLEFTHGSSLQVQQRIILQRWFSTTQESWKPPSQFRLLLH